VPNARTPSPRAPEQRTDTTRAIYRVVRAIPRGRVATYGQVAELAGIPSGHRVVARAMRSCPEELPWYRVVGRKDERRAQINVRDPEHAGLQRALLEKERVAFDAGGFIPFAKSGWLPRR
jgi:methylated-DNA-protein-cysteine methyltransferase-like protein